tara:strand:+ start:469 stop:1155 length:687 start_codon:yes stop_codon:yes gene_type:complete
VYKVFSIRKAQQAMPGSDRYTRSQAWRDGYYTRSAWDPECSSIEPITTLVADIQEYAENSEALAGPTNTPAQVIAKQSLIYVALRWYEMRITPTFLQDYNNYSPDVVTPAIIDTILSSMVAIIMPQPLTVSQSIFLAFMDDHVQAVHTFHTWQMVEEHMRNNRLPMPREEDIDYKDAVYMLVQHLKSTPHYTLHALLMQRQASDPFCNGCLMELQPTTTTVSFADSCL